MKGEKRDNNPTRGDLIEALRSLLVSEGPGDVVIVHEKSEHTMSVERQGNPEISKSDDPNQIHPEETMILTLVLPSEQLSAGQVRKAHRWFQNTSFDLYEQKIGGGPLALRVAEGTPARFIMWTIAGAEATADYVLQALAKILEISPNDTLNIQKSESD